MAIRGGDQQTEGRLRRDHRRQQRFLTWLLFLIGPVALVAAIIGGTTIGAVDEIVGRRTETATVPPEITDDPETETTRTVSPRRTSVHQTCDVNGDESEDSKDAALVLQFTSHLLSELEGRPNADVSDNGAIDSRDATLMLQYHAGMLAQCPPPVILVAKPPTATYMPSPTETETPTNTPTRPSTNTPMPTSTPSPTPRPTERIGGGCDVNGDQLVNSVDAEFIVQVVADLKEAEDLEIPDHADTTQDGTVDARDAELVLQVEARLFAHCEPLPTPTVTPSAVPSETPSWTPSTSPTPTAIVTASATSTGDGPVLQTSTPSPTVTDTPPPTVLFDTATPTVTPLPVPTA